VLALYIIAGIVLFILLVLSVPVDVALDLEATERAGTRMRVGWLFGLFWKDIRGRRKKKPRKKEKRDMRSFLSVLRVRGLPEGMYSVLWPVLVPVGALGPVNLKFEPAFDEATFEASVHGRVRVYPIQMVGPMLRFVFSPTGLRAIKATVVSRWRRKK